jgi:hypothetical protein
VSVDGGDWPRWRGDGRELFYAVEEAIMAVDVDMSSGRPVLGRPHRLFPRAPVGTGIDWPDGFDVTTDGERFVLVRNVQMENQTAPSIAVVQNWAVEFKKSEH